MNIYVTAPKGVAAAQLRVDISHKELTIGIRGNPPYVNVSDVSIGEKF